MASANNFAGKIALVTGGGSGIGRAVCQLLARDGARVSVCDLNLDSAQETVNTLAFPGYHLALKMDVSDKVSVDAGLKATIEGLKGTPTLLVNGAGISRISLFLEMPEKMFMDVIDVNLKGTFLVSQAVCKAMVEGGVAKGGAVVNLGSLNGEIALPTACQYAASKAGVINFSKTIAKELASTGIRVNCVMPGPIDTPMLDPLSAEFIAGVEQRNPLGRLGKPKEVAELVCFLLSDKSSYMVGSCPVIAGGHFL